MTIEQFDPSLPTPELSDVHIGEFLRAAQHSDAPDFGLDAARWHALQPYHRSDAPGWDARIAALDSADLILLIRLFTRIEMERSGWAAADRSQVILMARELKRRGEYPAALTKWIRENSTNRFLPHGSLLERL